MKNAKYKPENRFPNGWFQTGPLDRLSCGVPDPLDGCGLAARRSAAEGEETACAPHRRTRAPTPRHPLHPPTRANPDPDLSRTLSGGALFPTCLGIRRPCFVRWRLPLPGIIMKGLFKSKPRTPTELVRQTRDLLAYVDANPNPRDGKRDEKVSRLRFLYIYIYKGCLLFIKWNLDLSKL